MTLGLGQSVVRRHWSQRSRSPQESEKQWFESSIGEEGGDRFCLIIPSNEIPYFHFWFCWMGSKCQNSVSSSGVPSPVFLF